jgi:hypothetical protein
MGRRVRRDRVPLRRSELAFRAQSRILERSPRPPRVHYAPSRLRRGVGAAKRTVEGRRTKGREVRAVGAAAVYPLFGGLRGRGPAQLDNRPRVRWPCRLVHDYRAPLGTAPSVRADCRVMHVRAPMSSVHGRRAALPRSLRRRRGRVTAGDLIAHRYGPGYVGWSGCHKGREGFCDSDCISRPVRRTHGKSGEMNAAGRAPGRRITQNRPSCRREAES